ncbi:uncharacterized protein LOC114335693 [Diabrotica virgifera virgifera]|uniref:Uncharacterized protein LOC114335693 n=1 Tax=Diabrotica virgifera virgifera TaxID=50390 RepID=A0A6P7FYY1_DIAVI|nr:uncharacterized protein LOC114335693 [Diabrotica virgifera virgifera]
MFLVHKGFKQEEGMISQKRETLKNIDTPYFPTLLASKSSHRWSMDSSHYEHMFSKSYSDTKRSAHKSYTLSSTSSIERLSVFFKRGSEKVPFTPDQYGRYVNKMSSKSSKSMVDIIGLNTQWALKSERRKPVKQFCTGSRYLGEWNYFGMSGEGVYRYPHGVIYEGPFNAEGEFHGFGTLTYPNGQQFHGAWENGHLTTKLKSASGENVPTLFHVPDRRFSYEQKYGLGVPGKEYLTNRQPTPKLSNGCYDVGEGTYCPSNGYILSYTTEYYDRKFSVDRSSVVDYRFRLLNMEDEDWQYYQNNEVLADLKAHIDQNFTIDNERILEIPVQKKIDWIKKYCRSNPEYPVGYLPELYEVFTTGEKYDKMRVQQEYEKAPKYCDEECPTTDPGQSKLFPASFTTKVNRVFRKKTLDSLNAFRMRKKPITKKSTGGTSYKLSNNLSLKASEKDLLSIHTHGSHARKRSTYSVSKTADEQMQEIKKTIPKDEIEEIGDSVSALEDIKATAARTADILRQDAESDIINLSLTSTTSTLLQQQLLSGTSTLESLLYKKERKDQKPEVADRSTEISLASAEVTVPLKTDGLLFEPPKLKSVLKKTKRLADAIARGKKGKIIERSSAEQIVEKEFVRPRLIVSETSICYVERKPEEVMDKTKKRKRKKYLTDSKYQDLTNK